jgi:hypothetical protein
VNGGHGQRAWRGGGSLVACVLALALAVGCGGGSSSGDTNAADTAAQTTTTAVKRTTGPTVAVLQPLDGSEASGRAVYATKTDGSPSIKLRVQGLEPASPPARYIVWQKHSREDMVLLAAWPVGDDGRLSKDWTPSLASLAYLEGGVRTKLLITRIDKLSRMFAGSQNSYVHDVIGTPVLEGQFEGALVGAEEGE